MSLFLEMKCGAWGKGKVIVDKTVFTGKVKGVTTVLSGFFTKADECSVDRIASVQLVNEDNKGVGIVAGDAVAGGLLLGRLAAGAMAGGHKKSGAILTHPDGRQAVLFRDADNILEIIGVGQNANPLITKADFTALSPPEGECNEEKFEHLHRTHSGGKRHDYQNFT